nr:hypothetical protein [Hydrocarboniphaga effusa]
MAAAPRKLRRMERYRNLSGESGVVAYEAGVDFIRVRFAGGDIYRYDRTRPGARHVERMKRLAQSGRGLSTYISQHVHMAYASKE